MFKTTDPFTYYKSGTLKTQDKNTEIGTFLAKYQVTYDEDVSLSTGTANKGSHTNKRVYIVSCTQKVTGYNEAGLEYTLGAPGAPVNRLMAYNNYPVLLENTLSLTTAAEGADSKLVDYSPQTVNAQVQSSSSVADSNVAHSELSNSSTIGSSQAQSNSYSTKVGLQGNAFAMDVGHDSSATTSSDRNSSMGVNSGQSSSEDGSNSASMSVKDWGAYAAIDPLTNSPTWFFGQEYPWDIFSCRIPFLSGTSPQTNPNNPDQAMLLVPPYMAQRLSTKVSIGSSYQITILPPSQLSMYGYDFVMKAQWVVVIPNGDDDTVTIRHSMSGATASHAYDDSGGGKALHVYVDENPTDYVLTEGDSLDVVLDLGTMGLEPLGPQNIVGFIPSNFVVPPTPVVTPATAVVGFVIFSNSNTLLVKDVTQYALSNYPVGTGFFPTSRGMNAKLEPGYPLTFRILFKVTDVTSDYSLHFKHWRFEGGCIQLKVVINGDEDNALNKTLDAEEGEGAENNLLDLTLRNQNYASVNYCDTLVLGLNSIDVTLSTIDPDTYYALRAIAIQPS